MHALQSLIMELEADRSLDEPQKLRTRIEAMDRLDGYLSHAHLSIPDGEANLIHRGKTIHDQLEAANLRLYQELRDGIQRGAGPAALSPWWVAGGPREDPIAPLSGESYDYLDELISGVLHFEEPDAEVAASAPEMVFYQPTPARHILDLIARTAFTAKDVLMDLGSGLGHVSMLTSICTDASCIGIELEDAYVNCARRCARELNLNNLTFHQQDAREADLSSGTVFYLYTPFTGTILRSVLNSLQLEAASRTIRLCTFGPCTLTVAQENWLEIVGPLEPGRVAVFNSRC